MLITGTHHEGLPLPQLRGVNFATSYNPEGYLIGDDGSVWTRYTVCGKHPAAWRRIKTAPRKDGLKYKRAHLREDEGKGKVATRYAHRLVLEAFIGPCPENCQALHSDGDVSNNCLSNLRWGTPQENAADKYKHDTVLFGTKHYRSTCTVVDVLAMHYLHRTGKLSQDEIAELVGQTRSVVQLIVSGGGYPKETAAAEALLEGRLRDATAYLIEAGAFGGEIDGF